MTDTTTTPNLTIKDQIGTIFHDVQTMKIDIAVIKATSVIKRVDTLEKEVDVLKARVTTLWIFFGLATSLAVTIGGAFLMKGLGI